MKRLYIALALMAAVFVAGLFNTFYLGGLSEELSVLLTEAETRGESGDWETALALTQQAEDLWKEHDTYLHITLHHADTDAILLSFQEVTGLLQCREEGEYSAANAVLIGRIGLLYEQEQFSLKNLL